MGQVCKGICVRYTGEKITNGLKYSSGYKRCTNCSLFVKTFEIRVPVVRRNFELDLEINLKQPLVF